LDVFDFEVAARRALPAAHYGYIATGVNGEHTLRANRAAFDRYRIRARHLVDVSRVSLATEVFGRSWPSPIALAPAGSQRAFHPEGELAVARAARARGQVQILSTVSTVSVEDVASALHEPPWFQLYPLPEWEATRKLVERAEAAGCPVLVLTVDKPVITNRNTPVRFRRTDTRDCTLCHAAGPAGFSARKPMFAGITLARIEDLVALALTWDDVKRLRDATRMKLVLKGIVTGEDAALALEQGVDGLIVSNHGGRSEESGRATIEALPEVVAAVKGKIPVLVDSGFRRGTDVFKALALGARAVCIGRPYLWGLGAFGQAGVGAVLDLLNRELTTVMQTVGVASLRGLPARTLLGNEK
jgi:isopentenyl diphosphate isomerase/L-lactate dehydrogenase-like FMN-dependent dehydrogenase